ncbi:hypothetical protein Tco_0715510 [Tanacetum coccineum]
MSFSKRPGHDAVCYTKPLDSLKGWNDHFFWVDAFACPASFSWHTGKSVSNDHFPMSTEFNAEHYASFVAYPAPFHKYSEPFLCLVGMSRYYTLDENTYPEFLYENGEEMDLLTFIRTADPTKVRIGERQRGEDEPKLLDTTIGRVVPLLPVAPAHGVGELEVSVDRLFDEECNDGQAEQGDSANGGQGVGIQPVSGAVETNIEDVVPRHQEKRKSVIVDSDEPSHPAKKLRKDHGIPVGTSVAGKSMLEIQQLLAGAVQNATVRGEPVPSLPFVASSVSTTPEHSYHHSGTHILETKVDSLIKSSALAMKTATTVTVTAGAAMVVKETITKPSLFATGSSSVGGTESIPLGFSDHTGSDFFVGDIRTVIDPDSDLQKVLVDQVHELKFHPMRGFRRGKSAVWHLHFEERGFSAPSYFPLPGAAAISRAIEKGMQDGLAAGITHGREVEPLSSVALEGMESTSGTVPKTTTALSVTLSPVRSTPPISMDDYEIACADDQGNAGVDVDPFPNVDDAELNISLRLISRASSFYTKSTSAVLSVGMPISAGNTASVPYVNENGVSPLLDLVIVRCAHRT